MKIFKSPIFLILCIFVIIYLTFSFLNWRYEKSLPQRKFSSEIANAIEVENSHLYSRGFFVYTGKLRNVENLGRILKKDSSFKYYDNCVIKKMPLHGNYEIISNGSSIELIQFPFDSPPNFEFSFNDKYEYFTYKDISRLDTEGIGSFLLCKNGRFGYLLFFK